MHQNNIIDFFLFWCSITKVASSSCLVALRNFKLNTHNCDEPILVNVLAMLRVASVLSNSQFAPNLNTT